MQIAPALARTLFDRTRAAEWRVPMDAWAEALAASAAKNFAGRPVDMAEVERYLTGLHLDDLALACACARGDERAWEHFVAQHRAGLYRAADAIDASGGARELADALYGDLFAARERDGERQTLFRYFHGRSSLATWLRAVLAQRVIDRARSARRMDALPDEESPAALPAREERVDPERAQHVRAMRDALARAIAALDARDRLRLGCYYAQSLTLAESGRVLGEHEATVSRQLARTRRSIRDAVEHQLRSGQGFSDAQIAACFESIVEDAGPIDLRDLVPRKESTADRSKKERMP